MTTSVGRYSGGHRDSVDIVFSSGKVHFVVPDLTPPPVTHSVVQAALLESLLNSYVSGEPGGGSTSRNDTAKKSQLEDREP